MPAVQIIPLPECRHHLDVVAQWVWDEWGGKYNQQTFEQMKGILAGRPSCPPTLVALEGGAPIGVLGFRRILFRGREPLLLFINSLFVVATHRTRGVGTELVREALLRVGPEDASVYVWTHLRAWYEARGFVMLEEQAATGTAVLRAARPGA